MLILTNYGSEGQGGGGPGGTSGQGGQGGQNPSMMVDVNDILTQMFYLGRQCDQFEYTMIEYEQEIYPNNMAVYDNNLSSLKLMHLEIVQSSCNTIRVSERAMYLEQSIST